MISVNEPVAASFSKMGDGLGSKPNTAARFFLFVFAMTPHSSGHAVIVFLAQNHAMTNLGTAAGGCLCAVWLRFGCCHPAPAAQRPPAVDPHLKDDGDGHGE